MVALRSPYLAFNNDIDPYMGWRAVVEGTAQPIVEDDVEVRSMQLRSLGQDSKVRTLAFYCVVRQLSPQDLMLF